MGDGEVSDAFSAVEDAMREEREACVQVLRELYSRNGGTGGQAVLATAIELIEERKRCV